MPAILAHASAVRIYHPPVLAGAIPAIILAAGKSSRMGRSKALLPLGADDAPERIETFLTRLVATFHDAGIADVVVVVGHDAAAIVDAVKRRGTDARLVVNEEYEAGQLTSLLAGLRVIDHPGVSAALMTPVDVPLLAASTVRAVVDRYRDTRAPIVRPVHGARHGHPVLIDRTLFDSLRAIDPSRGANVVVRAHASAAGDVEVADEGAFTDVDTPAEYGDLISRLNR